LFEIENLSSGTITSYKEPEHVARNRQLRGRATCKEMMYNAFNTRIKELNETLATCTNPTQRASIEWQLKRLQPRNLSTEGVLFFGLRHTIVQQHHKQIPTENGDDDGTGCQNDTAGKECADGVPRQYESATGGAEQTRGKNPEGSGGDCISQTPKT
jgi:hypothetical protein